MLPETGNLLNQDFEMKQIPSKTYGLKEGIVEGTVDQLDAVKQAAYCILATDRYDWLIYSWNYGVELKDLIGKPMSVIKSKLRKRIREALMQDSRILDVDAFSFETREESLFSTFTVHSIFGEFGMNKEVKI